MSALALVDDLLADLLADPSELIERVRQVRDEGTDLDLKIDLAERLLTIYETEGRVRRVDPVPQPRDKRTGRKRPPLPMWEAVA